MSGSTTAPPKRKLDLDLIHAEGLVSRLQSLVTTVRSNSDPAKREAARGKIREVLDAVPKWRHPREKKLRAYRDASLTKNLRIAYKRLLPEVRILRKRFAADSEMQKEENIAFYVANQPEAKRVGKILGVKWTREFVLDLVAQSPKDWLLSQLAKLCGCGPETIRSRIHRKPKPRVKSPPV